jgi:predicted nucleic acid-binding protein
MIARFLDTNVFLYAAVAELPPVDVSKRQLAIDLIAEGDFSVSAQVQAEFYARFVGKFNAPPALAVEWVERIGIYQSVPVDSSLVTCGIAYSQRYQISYWDGAVIAAAHEAGATTLYTEDLNDGQRYGDVIAINPFKSAMN